MTTPKRMKSELNDLLCVATEVELPVWATHVAVRNNGSKAEPAAWLEEANDYIDEDPSQLEDGRWAGSYKHCYWTFISREQLNNNAKLPEDSGERIVVTDNSTGDEHE